MSQVFTLSLRRVIEITKNDIGLNDYPLPKGVPEGFREALNEKIVRHYYTREIGFETIELWRYNMRRKMHEIMPMYNQYYESQLLDIDPLSTVNITNNNEAIGNQDTSSNSSSTASSANEAESRNVSSEFPQTMLNASEDYATAAADANSKNAGRSSATDAQSGKASTKDVGKSSTTGYSIPATELLIRYRQTFLNVDMDVINDLNEMFMFTYTSGDAYTSY